MDILTGLNRTMDYIEENINNDVSADAAAGVTNYSAYHLQKLFAYLTDISLSEYVRRRKMTLAALELQNSDIKVIDLALKFGYDSADSFTRAFSRLHGVSPSQARKQGVSLRLYPKLSFQIKIKGETEMDYQIIQIDAFNVVGLKRRFYHDASRNPQGIPEFWDELRQNGKLKEILSHSDNRYDEAVGVCTNGDGEGLDYFIAATTSLDRAPEGLELFTFPANVYAVFHFVGPLHETMPKAERMIFSEWMPGSGYDPVDVADLEVYSTKPHDAPDYEFWCYVPVKKKM